jgi:hypothetical protein
MQHFRRIPSPHYFLILNRVDVKTLRAAIKISRLTGPVAAKQLFLVRMAKCLGSAEPRHHVLIRSSGVRFQQFGKKNDNESTAARSA